MPQIESPFPDPEPPVIDGLVWITNANREPTSPNDAATRDGLTVGPPRPTRFAEGSPKALAEQNIIGLYAPPLRRAAPPQLAAPISAPTPPPPEKPAKTEKKRMSTRRPTGGTAEGQLL